jgi:hypothetical protein
MSTDGCTTTSIWLASTLMYLYGGQSVLTRIERPDHDTRAHSTFHLHVPSLDAQEVEKDLEAGRLAISDLKEFSRQYSYLSKLLIDLKYRHQLDWVSPEWIRGRG